MICCRKKKLAGLAAVTMALIFTVCFSKSTFAADTSIYANSLLTPFLNAKSEHVYYKIQRQNDGCPKKHNAVWAEYYYNNIEFVASNDSAGYKNAINGILAGYDIFETESLLLGIMAGYGDSKLEQDQNSTEADNFNFGLYGGYQTGNWHLKSMFFSGYEKYKTKRAGNESEYNGYSASLDLELGYKIALNEANNLFLKPFAGVLGSYTTIEEAKEKGSGALTIGSDSLTMAQARAGLELNGQIVCKNWHSFILRLIFS
jgi:outer membrane autotransporter protein